MASTTLSPGRRAQLARMGFTAGCVGKTWNRATLNADDVDRITIPDTADGLEDMLRDGKQMAALFKQKDGFKDFVQKYAKTVVDRDRSISQQVSTEVERVLAQFLKDSKDTDGAVPINLNVSPSNITSLKRGSVYNAKAMGAQIDKEFKGSGDYFQSIWHQTRGDSHLQAKLARIRNAFSTNVPSEGGFLIPETLRSEMLSIALETSIVRPKARTIPMESLRVPIPAIDSTSNASSVYGGIVGYWTEEGAALTASQASFGRVVLDAKKLTAYTEVPNELISDSVISFQAFIDQIFPEALGFYEDYAFMRGTGVGEPLGFVSCPATISVAAESGQTSGTIVWENIIRMFSRMLPSSLGRAVWLATIDSFFELATMALSVGTGGSAVWLNNGVEGPPATILGRPVIFTEKLPALGTTGDLAFVDLGYYLVGDRQVMSATSSPHYKFQNDMTAFRIIERVDGRPWVQSAITPKNSGNTLSPFVQIATR